MLTDSYPANQAQISFNPLSSSYLITQHARNQSVEFINESPPIDEEISKYLEKKLEEYESQQREKAKIEAQYQQKYGTKKRQTKAENRHRLIYTVNLLNIAYIKVNPSRETIASIAGVHRNTFDNHKREMKAMHYLDWKSGKKTYETNTYYLPDHVKNQHIPRPKDFTIPWFLWKAIEKIIEKLDWSDQQIIYQQLIKDIVHHINSVYGRLRAFEKKNELNSSKDPPKTRAGPKRPIFRQLLEPFELSFKDQAILSSYGEAPLRAAINDFESYSGQVVNSMAFIISRCKSIKSKIEDLAKEVVATPEENLQWLKSYLSSESITNAVKFLQRTEKINRSTKEKTPYISLLIHKQFPKKSKLVIEQKVNGYWVDKVIELSRKKFRSTVMITLELSFKYAGR